MILSIISILASLPILLEWNQSRQSGYPYEIEINLNKMGLAANEVQIAADGHKLETTLLLDAASATTRYRFTVPEGTAALSLVKGTNITVESNLTDNIFSSCNWQAEDGAAVSTTEGGILIESTKWKNSSARARVRVPEGAAGKPVFFEMDCKSLTKMAWPARIWMAQYDKDGKLLPENVYDGRWTTHYRPYNKLTPFREAGRIHPRAAYIELIVGIRATAPKFDSFGLPLKDKDEARPRLLVSRLSLRVAGSIPFPGYNDSFFSDGVTDKVYDKSFVLNGARSFFYCTRSIAAWAGGVQLREEEQLFYPSAQGTVELWINPEWTADNKTKYIFEAGHYNAVPSKKKRTMMALSYQPVSHTLTLQMQDVDRKTFETKGKCSIPSGKWSHVAVTFLPDGEACAYINGEKVLSLALAGFTPVDLKNSSAPNDDGAMQFFLGGSMRTVRETYSELNGGRLLKGKADLLRVSSCIRYTSDFKPAKDYGLDKDTRAFFDFNRSFDGYSGGGAGFVPGSLQSPIDKYDHRIAGIQYYPEKLADDNNPALLLFPRVFNIPSEEDFASSDVVTSLSFDMKPGETRHIDVQKDVHTDCIEIYNTGGDVLKFPAVINDGDIDTRSYGDVAGSLDVPGSTDKEKVNRFFNYLLRITDYFMTHQATFPVGSDTPQNVEYQAMDVLNSYCGFECGPLNHAAAMLFATGAGCAANWTAGYGHSFEEVFYEGRNHIYDLSAQSFFPAMDNETAAGLRESDEQEYIQHRAGTGSGMHFTRLSTRKFDTRESVYPEKFAISLNPGERVRYWSVNEGQVNDLVTRGPKYMEDYSEITGAKVKSRDDNPKGGIYRVDRFFPEYGNGVLSFEGKPEESNPAFKNITEESFCYDVNSFYPIVAAEYEAVAADGKPINLEISTDGGRTFRPFSSPATYAVRARKGYLIKVKAPIGKVRTFRAATEFMVNSRALSGLLHTGKNDITLRAEGGSSAKVTYSYRSNGRHIGFEGAVKYGAIVGCERHLMLLDPTTGPLRVNVTGLSGKPVLVCGPGLKAKLSSKSGITVTATYAEPHFSWVKVKDGDCEQTLSVLVCKDARLVHAGANMTKKGDECSVTFKKIPAGKYELFTMQRLPVDADNKWVGRATVSLGTSEKFNVCCPVNKSLDYMKDIMGPDGGRGVWRWDAVMDKKYKYPYTLVGLIETESTDTASFAYKGKGDLLELDSVLIIPEPSREFNCEIIKNLFGRNHRPWVIEK